MYLNQQIIIYSQIDVTNFVSIFLKKKFVKIDIFSQCIDTLPWKNQPNEIKPKIINSCNSLLLKGSIVIYE